MSRIANILLRVRDTLNDPQSQRWGDAVLVRTLEEGQDDIAKQAKMFKATGYVVLQPGTYLYSLPDDAFQLLSVCYNDDIIPIKVASVDSSNTGSTPELIACNDLDVLHFIVYPTPSPLSDTTDTSNQVVFTTNSLYGLAVSFDAPSDSAATISTVQKGDFGLVSSVVEADSLKVTYVRQPNRIVGTSNDLELPPVYDTALKHYVTGKTLRNDTNEQNRVFGNEELELYARELVGIRDNSSKSWVSNRNFDTSYNPMG